MTGTSFVLRGLWYFRKSYLGVLAGAALGAMVLLGALMAGDSVKETLRRVAEARLGKADVVLTGDGRFFRSALADEMADSCAAPVLFLKATATAQASGRALGGVQVLGVDERFWKLGPDADWNVAPQGRDIFVNAHLARVLNVGLDETLVLRFEKPALIAADAPLAGTAGDLLTLSGGISEICSDQRFGRFSLEASQLPQATVFVPLERLQQAIGFEGKANLMLMRKRMGHDDISRSLGLRATLEDYGLTVDEVPLAKAVEIRTSRVFFDRQVAAVIRERFPAAQPVITYMANTIAANGRETPYSMVTAADREAAPFSASRSNGVVANEWLAADLAAKPGDAIRIDYYALDAANRLVERSADFSLEAVVPLEGLAADRMWMPDFPGVAAAENTADWDPGVPINMKRIRDKDEEYWDAHRGTPKLFLPLEKGREFFGNRWGEFTAFRIPDSLASRSDVALQLREAMTPARAGLVLRDVGAEAMAAAASPVDFAGLFLGMSVFLMAAAVALTAMMFRFHIEERNRESGLLTAVGIPVKTILRWRMMEGLCVVAAGCAIGALLAVAYTRFLLGFLETIWGGDGGGTGFGFHVAPASWLGGTAGFVALMMVVIRMVTRRQAGRSVGLRLEAGAEEVPRTVPAAVPWWAVVFAGLGLCALAGAGLLGAQGAFFLAGSAFLIAGLAAYRWVLRRRVGAQGGGLSPRRLAELNCGRRATRSMVVVGSLACGVFLVVSVAAFRKHGGGDWKERGSGSGGFAFWLETTSPLADLKDLGAERSRFGEVLPLRVGPGDDANCFNLNSVARPRLLATDAGMLSRLGAFQIKKVIEGDAKDWKLLREGEVMRAFVDESTLLWVLKKKIGDRITYQDEWGREFPVEIAGTLDGSVFQGSFVVDDASFLKRYPSSAGHRLFLMESAGDLESDRAVLQRALADRGGRVETTGERLAAFHGVENTYIAIFHLLGGLGVIIGSAGLGLVTARNLAERRYEFAILHAIGVPPAVTRGVVFREVGQFIRWGLGIGVAAAVVAILPSFSSAGVGKSLVWIALLVLLIAANAWFWSWLGFRRRVGRSSDFREGFF